MGSGAHLCAFGRALFGRHDGRHHVSRTLVDISMLLGTDTLTFVGRPDHKVAVHDEPLHLRIRERRCIDGARAGLRLGRGGAVDVHIYSQVNRCSVGAEGPRSRQGSAPVDNLALVLPPHLYNRFTGYPRIQYKQHDNDFAVSHRSSRSMISLTLARGMSANRVQQYRQDL